MISCQPRVFLGGENWIHKGDSLILQLKSENISDRRETNVTLKVKKFHIKEEAGTS